MQAAPRLRRPIAAVLVVLACALSAAGCSANATADEPDLPKGAEETLDKALTTMFSWRPAFDASPGPALQRARPFGTPDVARYLADLQDEMPENWAEWADQGVILTPSFHLEPVPGSEDTYTEYVRWARVTQTAVSRDGTTVGRYQFMLRPVVVSFIDGAWRISKITGVDDAGGGICPRTADNECRTPARDAETSAQGATPRPSPTQR